MLVHVCVCKNVWVCVRVCLWLCYWQRPHAERTHTHTNSLVNKRGTHTHTPISLTHTHTLKLETVDCLLSLSLIWVDNFFCLLYLGNISPYLCQHFDNLRTIKYWYWYLPNILTASASASASVSNKEICAVLRYYAYARWTRITKSMLLFRLQQ